MNKELRRWVAFAIVGAAFLAACGSGTDSVDSDTNSVPAGSIVDEVKASGLRVGFVGEIPWSFIENDGSGTFTGAEGEIVKECATQIGITEIYPVSAQFDSLLPGLQAKRWDIIAAGMSLRDQRLEIAIATQQMYGFGVRALVPKGNPDGITSWTDIKNKDLTVGMVSGGNYQESVEALGIKVKPYDSLESQILDMEAGRIDVVSNAELSLVDYVKKNPDKVELANPWNYEGIGASMPALYFNKDNVELRDAFNECVTKLKESGKLAEILTKWGFDPNSITPPAPGEPKG